MYAVGVPGFPPELVRANEASGLRVLVRLDRDGFQAKGPEGTPGFVSEMRIPPIALVSEPASLGQQLRKLPEANSEADHEIFYF